MKNQTLYIDRFSSVSSLEEREMVRAGAQRIRDGERRKR